MAILKENSVIVKSDGTTDLIATREWVNDNVGSNVTEQMEGLKKEVETLLKESSSAVSGTGAFVGSGKEVTIAHKAGKTPKHISVMPSQNPNGLLGEVWVRFDATNMYVGNSGKFTGTFNWVAIL